MSRERASAVMTGPLSVLLVDPMVFPADAFRGTGVSADRAYAVLVRVAMHYNDSTGACYPSQGLLAALTGLHKSRVREALDALEQVGMIVRLARGTATRGRNASPQFEFPWYSRLSTGGEMNGPATAGPIDRNPNGPATTGPIDSREWSREMVPLQRSEMVPLNGPAPQVQNGNVLNGEGGSVGDQTHGGKHPPGNPQDINCRICGQERLAKLTVPTPTPPTRAEREAETYCDSCGQKSGHQHTPTCALVVTS